MPSLIVIEAVCSTTSDAAAVVAAIHKARTTPTVRLKNLDIAMSGSFTREMNASISFHTESLATCQRTAHVFATKGGHETISGTTTT
jgi:hypothetical protein